MGLGEAVGRASWPVELGLEEELIGSNDSDRVTYIVQQGKLVAMPDSMRMMVPTDLDALSQLAAVFGGSAGSLCPRTGLVRRN